MPRPPHIAARSSVPPFRVMDVMADAARLEAQGRHIIHMEVGEPGLPTPAHAIEAAERALRDGRTGYTLALGVPDLRARIARHYGEAYGVDLDPARVIITTGSSAAFSLAFLTCFDVGDRVATARPGYPAYGRIMTALGLEPVEIGTTLEDNFQPTADHIAALENTHGLLIASPANPTGTMISEDHMAALAAACLEKGLWLISDEIYHRVTYGAPDVPAPDTTALDTTALDTTALDTTALAHHDEAIVINSFSKYYCMTGWRIGWMVVPEALIRPVERLAQNLFIAPPSVAQYAALASFDCTEELDARVAQYRANRNLLLDALSPLGLGFPQVDGAFYLYADVSAFTENSSAFCRRMLEEAGVATVPGIDFDDRDGRRYLRMSFAGSAEDMAEAARRLKDWLFSLK